MNFFTLLKRISQLREDYEKLNSKEMAELIMACSAFPLNLVGVRVLSDCKLKPYTGATGLMIGLDLLLCIYTTFYYWSMNKVSAVQGYAVLSLAIPVKK